MRPTIVRSLVPIALAAIAVTFTSCSRQAKASRSIAKADKAYAAGQYDEAEIEYKNALQTAGLNANALARLGTIYEAEGRPVQALSFLAKAKEMKPDDVDVRLKLATALLEAGAYVDASKEALYVLDHRPDDAQAPILLADSTHSAKDVEAAKTRLMALPATTAGKAPALLALGQLELRTGHTKEAEALFERARAADPKNANAFAALGAIYVSRNDLSSAEGAFKAAADLSPVRSPRRIQYAQFKIRVGDVEGARKLLEDISRQAPDYFPSLLMQAELALTQKKYAEAEELVGKAYSRDGTHPETLVLKARILAAKGETDKAITLLEKMAGLYPRSPLAQYQLGVAYASQGDLTKGRESLERAVGLAPNLSAAVLALAELNVRRRDYNAAIAALKPIVRDHPEIIPARLLLADAYRGVGSLDDALALYRQIEQQFPKDAQAPYLSGVVLRQQNKLDAARAAFSHALDLNPAAVAALEQLVMLDLAEKKFDSARSRVDAASARDPKSAQPKLLLARILFAQRDTAGAENALRQAIALQPDFSAAYMMLAQLYFSTNQYPQAVSNLQQVIAKNPKDVAALQTLAVLQDMQKDYPAARASYEKVLALAPKSAVALNNLAFLYAEKFNELDKAYDLAQQARAVTPDDPRAADTLAWILYRKKQYAAALSIVQDSAEKLPDDPDVQYHLGMIDYMLGQEQQAKAALERALQKSGTFGGNEEARRSLAILALGGTPTSADRAVLEKHLAQFPNDPVALTRLAAAYQRDGNLAKARETAETAVQASEKNVPAVLQLARICSAQGETKKALDLAKNARALAPDDQAIAQMLGRLAYDSRDYRWAASLLRDAADKSPDDATVQFSWSQAAYAIGQVDDAIAAAQAALKANPGFASAAEARRFVELATAASGAPQPSIVAQATKALEADPANLPASLVVAAANQARGDAKAARSAYEKVLERFPDFSPAVKGLALIYASTGEDVAKSASLVNKARQAYPADPDVAKAAGIVAFRQADYVRASNLLQESARQKDNDGEVQYYLGMCQYQLKKTAEAKRSLQRALQLGLKDELAGEARKALGSSN